MTGIVLIQGREQLTLPYGEYQFTLINEFDKIVSFQYRIDPSGIWTELGIGVIHSQLDALGVRYNYVDDKVCFWQEDDEFVYAMSSEFLGAHTFGDKTTYIVVRE